MFSFVILLPLIFNSIVAWVHPEPGIYQLGQPLFASVNLPGCREAALDYQASDETVWITAYHGECVGGHALIMVYPHGEVTLSQLTVHVRMIDGRIIEYPIVGEWIFQRVVRP